MRCVVIRKEARASIGEEVSMDDGGREVLIDNKVCEDVRVTCIGNERGNSKEGNAEEDAKGFHWT